MSLNGQFNDRSHLIVASTVVTAELGGGRLALMSDKDSEVFAISGNSRRIWELIDGQKSARRITEIVGCDDREGDPVGSGQIMAYLGILLDTGMIVVAEPA